MGDQGTLCTNVVFVPSSTVERVIEEIAEGKERGLAEEATFTELKKDHPDIKSFPGYTGLRIWHDPKTSVEQIMAETSLKRVI